MYPIKNEKKKVEKMSDTNSNGGSMLGTVYSVLHFVVAIYAIYLSFKCNKGFHMGGIVLAGCCPWVYVLYHLGVSNGCTTTS